MPADLLPRLLSNYNALVEKVDRHIRTLQTDFGDHIACSKGCDDCCRFLNLFSVEAVNLSAAFLCLPEKKRQQILKNAGHSKTGCPLLIKGACALYPQRPLICRTHGYPIVIEEKNEVKIDFCPKNFSGIKKFPGHSLIRIEQLNTTLSAVNRVFVNSLQADEPVPERFPVSQIFFLAADFLPDRKTGSGHDSKGQ